MDRDLVDKIPQMFSGPHTKLYDRVVDTVEKYGMAEHIKSGVLVGFSGGADSVLLLLFLLEYRRRTQDFPILAVHINHGIRGAEADRDESFSREFSATLGVEFQSYKLDVPSIAINDGIGIEEAARNTRYSKFKEIILGRNNIKTIAVAHNSDDNAETVIFNILRGSGSRGASGIRPVRDNIIRPLLRLEKSDIISLLNSCDIPFVTDSTNLSLEYSRNFIRHKIIPELRSLTSGAADMISRFSENLRMDDEFITMAAESFIIGRKVITNKELRQLHPSLFLRVLSIMAAGARAGINSAAATDIYKLLDKDDFSYSLPGGATFITEYGCCRVVGSKEDFLKEFSFDVKMGRNTLSPFSSELILSSDSVQKTYSNVYKISIQADLSSAIIVGNLYFRSKKDGDSIFYGGMTRKLKKLFNDRKIPPSMRDSIPVLCDDRGVLWVPGFGVRNDSPAKEERKTLYALFLTDGYNGESKPRLYSASEFKK